MAQRSMVVVDDSSPVPAIGDLVYADTATSFKRLSAVALGSVLISMGVGVAPAYSASPRLTAINDANGNASLAFIATPNAVNSVSLLNAVAGDDPLIAAAGTDADCGIGLRSKGTDPSYLAGSAGTPIVGAATVAAASRLGFHDKAAAPIARPAFIAAPTAPGAVYAQAEAVSMETAVNEMRNVLINYGLINPV